MNICKKDQNIIINSFKKLTPSWKLSKFQEFFKLPGLEKELCTSNQSAKVSTQENTRPPSETQLELSNIKTSLTQKVNLFSAGSIATRYSEWENLTNDTEVLSTVSGMPLDICDEEFSFENKPIEMKFSSKEESFLIKEIEKLLGKGVIRQSIHEEGEFISPIFLFQSPLIHSD